MRITYGETLWQLENLALEQVVAGRGNQIVLVPEQLSHQMEKSLCMAGGDTIGLGTEVLSFTRLASRLTALYGGGARQAVDKGGRLMAMALAVSQVSSRLMLYGASSRKTDFILKLLSTVDELKSDWLDSNALRGVLTKVSGQLAVKLEELALIFDSYETVLATMGLDPADRMAFLVQQLKDHNYGQGKTFFVLGFSDFTGQQMTILSQLAKQGGEFHFFFPQGNGGRSIPLETGEQLEAMASRLGIPVIRETMESAQTGALSHVRKNLFGAHDVPYLEETQEIFLHNSSDLHGAVLDVAGKLHQWVRQGYRWRDLAICATQLDQVEPVLTGIFDQFDIPFYVAGNDPIDQKSVVATLLTALSAIASNLALEDVMVYLKSPLSPLTLDQCDQIGKYAFVWNISGGKWGKEWTWHPKGFGNQMEPADLERLEQLNQVRTLGVGPLLALGTDLKRATSVAGQVEAVYQFLVDTQVPEQVAQMEAQTQGQEAQVYGQLWDVIVQALEQLHGVMGNTVYGVEDFIALTRTLVTQYTVGTIPATLDSVLVGDMASMRFATCQALVILGADEGMLPAQSVDHGLLTLTERKTLQNAGLGLLAEEGATLERELLTIGQVLSACQKELGLYTYQGTPSVVYNGIVNLVPQVAVETDQDIPWIYQTNLKALGQFLAGKVESGAGLWWETAQAVERQADYAFGTLSKESVTRLYGQALRLSATKIDTVAGCHLAYFLRYGLGLEEVRQATFDAPIYGTYVHWVLEQVAKTVMEQGGFEKVTPEDLSHLAKSLVGAFQDDTLETMCQESPRMAYLFQRNQEEVLWVAKELGEELAVSQFRPAGFELEFSQNGQLPPLEITGETMKATLMGYVDRVDTFTQGDVTYVRIVDYKTGKKTFDYTDVSQGMGMQMLLYLFAMCQPGGNFLGNRLQPGGVLYFPARKTVLSQTNWLPPEEVAGKRQSEQVRKGLVANSNLVVDAMEQTDGAYRFLPVKRNKDGDLTGDVASPTQMTQLKDHVQKKLTQLVDTIGSGDVTANPIQRGSDHCACTYCPYDAMCHGGEKRSLAKMTAKEFWNALEQEEQDG